MHEKHELVGDTGIEPVASSVWGKRSPTELIARHFHRKLLIILNIFVWSLCEVYKVVWSRPRALWSHVFVCEVFPIQVYIHLFCTWSKEPLICIWSFSNPWSNDCWSLRRHATRQQNSIKSIGETLLHFFSILIGALFVMLPCSSHDVVAQLSKGVCQQIGKI